MSKSTSNRALLLEPQTARKPKQKRGFPLTQRGDNRWQKKVNGRTYYFRGTKQEALTEWLRVKDDLMAGHEPAAKTGELTIVELVNHFLTFKKEQLERTPPKLTQRSWDDYFKTCGKIIGSMGRTKLVRDLNSNHFAKLRRDLAKKARGAGEVSVVTLKNEITRTQALFNYAYKHDLVETKVKGMAALDKPGSKELKRSTKQSRPKATLTRNELLDILDIATPQMRAMCLLGINLGAGNTDVAKMQPEHIEGEWYECDRHKTDEYRRGKLWRETVDAITAAGGLPFKTKHGGEWVTPKNDALTKEFKKLLKRCDIHAPHASFYSLRHTFATEARRAGDDAAVRVVMGQKEHTVLAAHYTHEFDDVRLATITDHMHQWLFGGESHE